MAWHATTAAGIEISKAAQILLVFQRLPSQNQKPMTRSSLYPWLSPICFFLCVSSLFGQGQSPLPAIPAGTNLNDPRVLLPLAISANSLDVSGLTPWHL